VIDDYGPRYADLDLPVVDGLGPDVDPARAALAGRLLGALEADPALAARVSQLNVANPHDAVVILDGDGRSCTWATRGSSSACAPTSSSPRRCTSACRRSTTWTCG